jgi:MazG family protein
MDSDRLSKAIVALTNLVARLRGPEGCPWDARQTDSTIKIYLIEEAFEVLDAIEKSSPEDVCLELGDLLFQVLFLARLADERNEFDFIDVVEKITKKMIRRHPHVFGEVKVNSAEDVANNWANIKKAEKGKTNDLSHLLSSVPVNLPALLRAHRLSERASRMDFQGVNPDETWLKVQKGFDELRSAIASEGGDRIAEIIGDLLFGLASLSRQYRLNAENILREANNRFLEYFIMIERELKNSGIEPEKATAEQMKSACKKVKSPVG